MRRRIATMLLLLGAFPALAGSAGDAIGARITARPEGSTTRSTIALAPVRTVSTDFEIVVRRSVFRAKRQVDVDIELDGLDGSVGIRLNKPVKMALGVERVAFQVHMLDAMGVEVELLTIEIPEGTTDLEFPIAFPDHGTYRLEMSSDDILIAPARARLIPDGHHRIELQVGDAAASIARVRAGLSAPTIAH